MEGSNTKSLLCLCCKSGPISAFVRIPRTGYTAGQVIHISGEVDNKSNTPMLKSYVKLVQVKIWFFSVTNSLEKLLWSSVCKLTRAGLTMRKTRQSAKGLRKRRVLQRQNNDRKGSSCTKSKGKGPTKVKMKAMNP
jgi:hypothetical protein